MTRFSPGFLKGSASVHALTLSFIGFAAINNSVTSTHTFSSISFGTAAANRYVCVAFGAHNSTGRTLNSVTIGGVTATIEFTSGALNTAAGIVGIAYANVPTGTSGDIVFNWSANFATGTTNGVGVNVYVVQGGMSVPSADSYTFTGSTPNKNFSVPAFGIAIVCGVPTNVNRTVTGDFTTDNNFTQYAGGLAIYSGSVNDLTGSPTTPLFHGTSWSSTVSAIAGVAFGPA